MMSTSYANLNYIKFSTDGGARTYIRNHFHDQIDCFPVLYYKIIFIEVTTEVSDCFKRFFPLTCTNLGLLKLQINLSFLSLICLSLNPYLLADIDLNLILFSYYDIQKNKIAIREA